MTTRYEKLARALVQDVGAERWRVGTQLPTETELSKTYSLSRGTVRAALDIVERLGLITRRPGVGTIVISRHPTTGFVRSIASLDDLVQYSEETYRRVRDICSVVADVELAERLGCKPGQRWTRIIMVRDGSSAEEAVCITEAYVEPELATAIKDLVEAPHGLLSEMIERRTGCTTYAVNQQIRAMLLSARQADILSSAEGAPGLEIRRHYINNSGRTFQITVSTHPAERFEYTMSLTRDPSP